VEPDFEDVPKPASKNKSSKKGKKKDDDDWSDKEANVELEISGDEAIEDIPKVSNKKKSAKKGKKKDDVSDNEEINNGLENIPKPITKKKAGKKGNKKDEKDDFSEGDEKNDRKLSEGEECNIGDVPILIKKKASKKYKKRDSDDTWTEKEVNLDLNARSSDDEPLPIKAKGKKNPKQTSNFFAAMSEANMSNDEEDYPYKENDESQPIKKASNSKSSHKNSQLESKDEFTNEITEKH